MYFKDIDDKLLTEASQILFDADNPYIPEYQDVSNHAVRRFIQRATKKGKVNDDQDRLLCNMQLGKILSPNYKRDHYMGKTFDDKYGITYWYRGQSEDGKMKYLIPQTSNGSIKTIFNWGFENDKVKFLKSRIIQLTKKLEKEYTNEK